MGWLEFQAWLGVMQRQRDGVPSSPDTWEGTENDPWWVEGRAERDRERRG